MCKIQLKVDKGSFTKLAEKKKKTQIFSTCGIISSETELPVLAIKTEFC